ncbi:hypothetical protein QL285_017358 [Trifolium repens]|nr:hypothetical protein QL285_017358 [Trifolium repens]
MKKTKSKMKQSKTPATKQDGNTMKEQPATKKTSKGAGKTKTKAKKSQNTEKLETTFTAVFHHGSELVTENNKKFYRGGVQTIVSGEKLEDWCSKYHVYNLVRGWGYAENSFRIWTIFDNYYDGAMWKLREDDDYMEVATFIVGSGRDAPIFVEHLVENENNSDVDEHDSDYAKGVKFYDSEDERTVGLDDGFSVAADERKKNEDNMRIVVSSIGCTNSKWVSKSVVQLMQSNQKVRMKDIQHYMRTHFSLNINPNTAWKAKQYATAIIEGDSDKQYALLRRYGDELKRVCKQNTVKIGVERPIGSLHPRFASFYFCFDGCKKGFNNGCRPFIGVDGCHLKTKYGGQLLIAVGRDPNDQYFPLAFGIVETETKESWRWFIQLLMEDIGQDKRIVYISDQQKGLVAVFDEMFDRIEHRLCLRHLYANFKKNFGGGALIRDLMMGAAKATYIQAWEAKMDELKKVEYKAWEWLMKVPTKTWCKHAFSHYSKCDVLMNNLSESFNATILSARDKPILTLAEWIRNYLMNRIMQSSIKLEKWEHRIMPNPLKRLEKEIKMTGSWGPILTNIETWQVSHIYNQQQFIVDTQKQTCTSGFWELVGIPCRHAIAALGYRKQDPAEFVHNCYSKEKYAQCYGYGISAINGVDMWPKPAEGVDDTILPPSYKNGPGRPRKLRIRGTDEDGARKRRRVATYTCTRCSQPGHNALSCKAKEQCPKGLKRKRKPAKGKGNAPPKSQSQEATQTSAPAADQEATQASQVSQNPTQVSEDQNPTQASQIVDATQVTAEDQNPTQASQTDDAAQVTQDLFDDLPDEVMATIPDAALCSPKASLVSPKSTLGSPRSLKEKKKKMKRVSALYHGKPRRRSERVKSQNFKKPITGIGSTQDAPIEIKEADADSTPHDDSKLGTCFRTMRSWKDIPKKKN